MLSQLSFSGRSVLITGGSRGLGKATAYLFTSLDATVITASRHPVTDVCLSAHHFRADMADPAQVDELSSLVLARYGCPDVLVNNAATNLRSALDDFDAVKFTQELVVNLVAPTMLTGTFGRAMAGLGRGNIINVSSVRAVLPGNSIGYGMTKAALENLTRSAAVKYGSAGVRINAVAPGPMDTTMLSAPDSAARDKLLRDNALGKSIAVDEVASAIIFLSSQMASAITGVVLHVDGGRFLAGRY
jgi:NAD(P)-dependent dehydrogenase (short-subunit alcohol dehydrogenase family)